MKNVAIIGGSGFIGRHTAEELIRHNIGVTIIDLDPPTTHGVTWWECDATDYSQLFKALDSERFDAVYMFAAISDSNLNHKHIGYSVETNIMSLMNTLSLMNDLHIPRVIFSSSVWVYSLCDDTNVSEESKLILNKCDHMYTSSKAYCENLIKTYGQVRGLGYTILRYGIAYGPGCSPEMVVSKFMANAINGKPLVITGNGNIYRNFMFVSDHARANRLALANGAKNQIINLEGPEKITIQEVVDRVCELYPEGIEVHESGVRYGDYEGKNVSNKKAKRLLGWEPKILFNEGSRRLYEHIKESVSDRAPCGR